MYFGESFVHTVYIISIFVVIFVLGLVAVLIVAYQMYKIQKNFRKSEV